MFEYRIPLHVDFALDDHLKSKENPALHEVIRGNCNTNNDYFSVKQSKEQIRLAKQLQFNLTLINMKEFHSAYKYVGRFFLCCGEATS